LEGKQIGLKVLHLIALRGGMELEFAIVAKKKTENKIKQSFKKIMKKKKRKHQSLT
jgi:hypothetical protein